MDGKLFKYLDRVIVYPEQFNIIYFTETIDFIYGKLKVDLIFDYENHKTDLHWFNQKILIYYYLFQKDYKNRFKKSYKKVWVRQFEISALKFNKRSLNQLDLMLYMIEMKLLKTVRDLAKLMEIFKNGPITNYQLNIYEERIGELICPIDYIPPKKTIKKTSNSQNTILKGIKIFNYSEDHSKLDRFIKRLNKKPIKSKVEQALIILMAAKTKGLIDLQSIPTNIIFDYGRQKLGFNFTDKAFYKQFSILNNNKKFQNDPQGKKYFDLRMNVFLAKFDRFLKI